MKCLYLRQQQLCRIGGSSFRGSDDHRFVVGGQLKRRKQILCFVLFVVG